jgi:hypothetical protein
MRVDRLAIPRSRDPCAEGGRNEAIAVFDYVLLMPARCVRVRRCM